MAIGRGEVEAVLAAMWERVLGREGIGPEHDFFELGGSQFEAVKVLDLVEDAFDVRLGVPAFLASSTVATLAAAVTGAQASAAGVKRGGGGPSATTVAPVAFSQEGMLWHEQFAPGCQNLPPLARRYRGPLQVDVLERALGEIVRRHEPLRTTFELQQGRMVQVVSPPGPYRLGVRDLSGLGPGEQEAELSAALSHATRPFDLARGPLFEPTLFRFGEDHHVLVLRVHHSVYDDWSVGVFRRELSRLYAAFVSGAGSPLTELPLSFTDFARRQRRRLAGRAGTDELSYWSRQLGGAPLSLQLNLGDPHRPLGAAQPSAQPVSVELPGALADQLRALARRHRATLFMTLLTAFQLVLHGHTAQDDLLLASVVANRNRRELEAMIGCFTKKVLLRLRLRGDPTFAHLLADAREVVLGALSHQDLPFETVLQEVLGPPAARHGLVPTVAVVFQGVVAHSEEVVLPGVATSGFDTSATTARAHFAGGPDEGEAGATAAPWGAGLYSRTFLIVSAAEDGGRLSLVARGAFHRPAAERLLLALHDVLAHVAAHPDRPVSELAPCGAVGQSTQGGWVELRGFRVDLGRIEAALGACPGVAAVLVRVGEDEDGEPCLVAHVVPGADGPPSLAALRAFLWSRLPGYAWPAHMVVTTELPDPGGAETGERSPPGHTEEAGQTEEAGRLAALWAEALGVDEVEGTANYWQRFSFLDALAQARQAGIDMRDEQVTRNRTVAALGTELAAERLADRRE